MNIMYYEYGKIPFDEFKSTADAFVEASEKEGKVPLVLPTDITVLQDVDILCLKEIRDVIDDEIKRMEQENKLNMEY